MRKPLQAVYTVVELAEMAGISRRRMARLLESAGVQFIHSGRARLVTLLELQNKCASLWDSAKLLKNLKDIALAEHEELARRVAKINDAERPRTTAGNLSTRDTG